MQAERERWLPRKELAAIVSERVRPISHRSFERWPIRAKRIGRKAHHELHEVLACARREVEGAATVMQSPRRQKGGGAADRRLSTPIKSLQRQPP
jgi:hypothetical protein